AHDLGCVQGKFFLSIFIHQPGEQLLVEASPVDADAHRLRVPDRALDHGRELLIALHALADVAGIDAVLGEGLRAIGILREQLVAVVVEIADQRHLAVARVEPLADARHLRRGLGRIDRDAHQLGAGARQRLDLPRGRLGVLGVGIGHRLHHHRRTAADAHVLDRDLARNPAIHGLRNSAQGMVNLAMSCLVCGRRSSERSLCRTVTWLALPMTTSNGPRPCTTRSQPGGLSEDSSCRPLASFTSSHASSSQRRTMRCTPAGTGFTLTAVSFTILSCGGDAAFSFIATTCSGTFSGILATATGSAGTGVWRTAGATFGADATGAGRELCSR